MKFNVTVTYTYEVADKGINREYGTTDPLVMADIDQENLQNDPGIIGSDLTAEQYTVKVVPA